MRIICFANNKGGVAKTTSTVQFGFGLARKGFKVLTIDADPQGNTTFSVLGKQEKDRTMLDVMLGERTIIECMRSTLQTGLFIIPAHIDLSASDIMLATVPGRERLLVKALKPMNQQFDFVLIDTPPTLGMMTVNALVSSTDIIIPVSPTTYGLNGIDIFESTLQQLRQNLDIELPVIGVIVTQDSNTRIYNEMKAAIKEHFGNLLFETVVPRNIKIEEAQNKSKSIWEYDPKSSGAIAYESLLKEFLERVNIK